MTDKAALQSATPPRPKTARPTGRPIDSLHALLSELEILRGIGSELVDAIVARGRLRELAKGAPLLVTGQLNSEMFIVVSGELSVHLGEHGNLSSSIAVLRSGDTVGELSVIDQRPVGATVIAHSDAKLLSIDEILFWHVVRGSHLFAVRLMLKLAERLRANNSAVQANMEMCAQLEAVALSDALTGVHSRRWLNETLPRICDRHRRGEQPLCIAVIDVDHFKRVNDTYGHPTGDIVLVEVASALRTRLRPTDFVARFGGEEFVMILPNTPLVGAHVAAERIRNAVRQWPLVARSGEPLPPVTVSIGLAELTPDVDATQLIENADAALYRAKHNGRDRVEA